MQTLMGEALGQHDPNEWCLFISSSKVSLKLCCSVLEIVPFTWQHAHTSVREAPEVK